MIDDVVLLMNRDAWYAGKPRSNGFILCTHKKSTCVAARCFFVLLDLVPG